MNLVAVGDSITAGVGATTAYPALIASSLRSQAFNQGVSGAGWPILAAQAAKEVDPRLSRTDRAFCTDPDLVLFAGTNDIFNEEKTSAQTYALFQTYLSARLVAGWKPNKIVVVTMLPRSKSKENDRSAYNNNLVSGAATYGYMLARVDLDPNIGCSGCEANMSFYVDGVHPNNTGQEMLANLICEAMHLPKTTTCPPYTSRGSHP
jgi:lysophospholipase L1-like esterase